MKKINKKGRSLRAMFLLAFICIFSQNTKAQSFTQTSMFDTITVNNDTLEWYISSSALNAYGNVTLTVYFEGDFGSTSENINVHGYNWSFIGNTGNSPSNNDCNPGLDSTTFIVPAASYNSWTAMNDTIWFYGIISPNVDYFCTTNHAKAKVTYNYCLSPNAQIANFTLAGSPFCGNQAAISLTATPSGGAFSGPGVTGNTFNPSAVAPGMYTITYTVTDTTGCTSSDFETITVKAVPAISGNTMILCKGNTASLTATGADSYIWYSDAALTNELDTTNSTTPFLTGPLNQTTTFYLAAFDTVNTFNIASISDTGSVVTDHDILSGDDRGGMAVTNNFVYVVGDNNTARFDLNLTPASGISLPVNDGIFSNLANGKLYTIYDGNAIPNYPSTYNFSQIVELTDSLALTSNTITLSQTIVLGSNIDYTGIFAGRDLLIVYSGNNSHWYAVNLPSGQVTDLGTLANPEFYGSENWAVWGVAEFDGTNYSVLFRHNSADAIHRRVLPAQASTVVKTFSNISDLASFTYLPTNNRLYFHYEGSGQFGGQNETIGYIYAVSNASNAVAVPAFNCSGIATVTVAPFATFAPLATPTLCINYPAITLTEGSPAGGTYSGNGVSGNNFNAATAGAGTHTITYTHNGPNNCTTTATTTIFVDVCTSLGENSPFEFSVFPNPGTGVYNVNINSGVASDMNLEVYSVEGKKVYSQAGTAHSGKNTVSLNVSHLANGIYYLRIVTGEGSTTTKLVKAN